MEDLARRARGEAVITHIPTGLGPVDKTFGGLEVQAVTLVLGHSGDGKTTLMQEYARGAARAGLGSLSFYLEDPRRRLADREFARLTNKASHRIARLDPELGDEFPDQLRAAVLEATWAERVGVVTGDIEPDEILDICESTTHVGGAPVRLVQIDYPQRFAADESSLESVMVQFTKGAATLAEAREQAWVIGSQIKTQVLERGRLRYEKRGDVRGFRPGRGDAMWCRRMEQLCRVEQCWFREGRWLRESGDGDATDNRGELWTLKANYGPEGVVTLGYDGARARIYELETT